MPFMAPDAGQRIEPDARSIPSLVNLAAVIVLDETVNERPVSGLVVDALNRHCPANVLIEKPALSDEMLIALSADGRVPVNEAYLTVVPASIVPVLFGAAAATGPMQFLMYPGPAVANAVVVVLGMGLAVSLSSISTSHISRSLLRVRLPLAPMVLALEEIDLLACAVATAKPQVTRTTAPTSIIRMRFFM